MKKKIFTILTVIFIIVTGFAQTPQKLSYQAIICDTYEKLVENHEVVSALVSVYALDGRLVKISGYKDKLDLSDLREGLCVV